MTELALIPLEQANLFIAGLLLIAVLLPDGQAGLVLAPLCEGLGLLTREQAQRIQAHPELSSALVSVQVKMPGGGVRSVNVLLSWGIPLWLGGIRLGGRPPAYRRRVLLLQRSVNVALARCFAGSAVPAPAQGALPEPRAARHARRSMQARTNPQRSSRPLQEGSAEELDDIRAAIQRLERGLEEVQAKLRNSQQEQQARNARDEARLARLEGAQVREKARLDHLLDHLGRLVAHLTAEPLASRAELVVTERLMKAVIERLLLLEERVSQLEPKPPPRSKGGRPRRDRRR